MEEEATEAIEIEHHEMQSFAGVQPRLTINLQHGHGSFLSNISLSSNVISYTRFARTVVYILLLVTCVPIATGGGFTIVFIEDGNYNGAVLAFFAGTWNKLILLTICNKLCVTIFEQNRHKTPFLPKRSVCWYRDELKKTQMEK